MIVRHLYLRIIRMLCGGADMDGRQGERQRAPRWLALAAVLTLVHGCATAPERPNPLPEEALPAAEIPGIPNARYWGDEPSPYTKAWMSASEAELRVLYSGVMNRKHTYLAISGGGDNGAFGAGLLSGWSAVGTRPVFTMVTGISTGALLAPFAFLGSDYDAQLREMYTTYSTEDLIERRGVLNIINNDAASGTEPLRAMIARYITPVVMQAIAAEHRKGRALLIATTNLDAARPVIWRIGHIAASGAPNALGLIHDIMLASASIPVVFPPVIIEVQADGQRHDEMHVDGGTTAQVFLYPTGVDWSRVQKKLGVKGRPTLYVIRNARLAPQYETVKRRLGPIAGRSVSSLIRTQGIGDMYRLYVETQRHGLDYNLALIPDDFDESPEELFDPEYMGKLFELGYRMAEAGYPRQKAPPGFELP